MSCRRHTCGTRRRDERAGRALQRRALRRAGRLMNPLRGLARLRGRGRPGTEASKPMACLTDRLPDQTPGTGAATQGARRGAAIIQGDETMSLSLIRSHLQTAGEHVGDILWWTLEDARVTRGRLEEVWADAGLSPAFLPEPPTPEKALKTAVREAQAGQQDRRHGTVARREHRTAAVLARRPAPASTGAPRARGSRRGLPGRARARRRAGSGTARGWCGQRPEAFAGRGRTCQPTPHPVAARGSGCPRIPRCAPTASGPGTRIAPPATSTCSASATGGAAARHVRGGGPGNRPGRRRHP